MVHWYAYLFGSRARGDHRHDSDIDVLLTPVRVASAHPVAKDVDLNDLIERLRPLAIEYGGPLDLFVDNGVDWWAAYDPERVILLGSASGRFIRSQIEKLERTLRPLTRGELLSF